LEKPGVEDPQTFFANPERYHGLAAKKSKRLAQKYAELMK
jgi:adenylosuccinate lyase